MKPILFNTEMVKAILEGRKTVTRRVVKNIPEGLGNSTIGTIKREDGTITCYGVETIPYQIGDILYVRETWSDLPETYFLYRADCPYVWNDSEKEIRLESKEIKWRPSIHMPKEAARIFLKVTDVRVERVQDITVEDIQKEGIEIPISRLEFMNLWNSTI